MAIKTMKELDAERNKIKSMAELDAERSKLKTMAELDAERAKSKKPVSEYDEIASQFYDTDISKYKKKDKKADISKGEKFRSFVDGYADAVLLGLPTQYIYPFLDKVSLSADLKIADILDKDKDEVKKVHSEMREREKYVSENTKAQQNIGKAIGYMQTGSAFAKAGKALPVLGKISNPIARRIAGNAIGDGGMEIAEGLIRKETPKEIAIRTGLGVLFGNVGDFGFEALGKQIGKLTKGQLDDVIETIVKEQNVTREEVEYEIKKIYKGPENPILEDVMKQYDKRLESGKWLLDKKVPEARGHIGNIIDEFEPKITKAENATPKEIEDYIQKFRQADFEEIKKPIPKLEAQQKATSTVETLRANEQPNFKSVTNDLGNTVGAQQKSLKQEMLDKYGYMKEGTNPDRIMIVPKKTADNKAVSQFARTVAESKNVTDEMADTIDKRIIQGDFSHTIFKDKKALENADAIISRQGMTGAKLQWDSVSNGNKIADKTDIALGQRLLVEAANRGDTDEVQKLLSDLVIQGTRSGQNVQALSMLKKMTPEGKLYYFEKYIQNQNKDLIERFGQNASQIEVPKELAQKMLDAKTQLQIEEVEYEIIKDIGSKIPATWYDKANAWRYMSMLGNPKTHIRNIVGNAAFYPFRKFRDIIGTGLEKGLVPEGQRTKAILNPLSKTDKSLKDFALSNFSENSKALTSTGKVNIENEILKNRQIFKTKWLEAFRKTNFDALDAEDIWFLKPAYTDSFAQYMKANKLTTDFLKSGTSEAVEALTKAEQYATEQALKATYRDASAVASAISRFTNAPTNNKFKKLGQVAVEGILPFKKTPINVMKRGVEYSPAGLIRGITSMTKGVKSGTKTASQAVEEVAQGLTGTGIMILGAYLAKSGIVTGKNQGSYKAQSFDAMQGEQQYSLSVNDTSYTLDWSAPMSLPFFMGVELYNSSNKRGTMQGNFARFADAMTNISDPLFNLSMLQGINKLLGGYEGSAGTAIRDTATNYLGQYVPTLGGQVARTVDPVRRTTYASKESPLTKSGEQFLRKQLGKIPVASANLEPFVDSLGRTQEISSISERLFTNFISPGYIGKKDPTQAEKEIDRLYKSVGQTEVLPSYAPSNVQIKGETLYLTPKEKTQFAKTYGQESLKEIDRLIKTDKYKRLPDYVKGPRKDKAALIQNIYKDAREKAKEELLNNRK